LGQSIARIVVVFTEKLELVAGVGVKDRISLVLNWRSETHCVEEGKRGIVVKLPRLRGGEES
jgi:hypothetical protein